MCTCRNSLVTINTTGHDSAERRLTVLHHTYLYRRGVRSQRDIIFTVILLDKESVLHPPCRVLFREVQGGEVMPVILNFRTYGNNEANAIEDVDDLVTDFCFGVL